MLIYMANLAGRAQKMAGSGRGRGGRQALENAMGLCIGRSSARYVLASLCSVHSNMSF